MYLVNHNEQGQLYKYKVIDKRVSKVDISTNLLRKSIVGLALERQEIVVVNDLKRCSSFNPDIDSLGHKKPQHVLVAPLIEYEKSGKVKRIIGLLHLVNKLGQFEGFDPEDLFISILIHQSSGILMSIMLKKEMLYVEATAKTMVEECTSMYREISTEGIIEVLNRICVSFFGVQRGQLFISDKDHFWTVKVADRRSLSSNALNRLKITGSAGVLQSVSKTRRLLVVPNWSGNDREPTESDISAKLVDFSIAAYPIHNNSAPSVIAVLVLMVLLAT